MNDDRLAGEPRIEQLEDRQRFVLHLGDEYAGLAQYAEHGGQRVFLHTVIDGRFEGRGLGGRLIRSALDTTREQGRRIVPVCSFVRRYLRDHHEWDDLVDRADPGLLAALPD